MQLQENLGEFEGAGIGIVGMTYDSPELQQAFVDKFSITYPMLSDQDAASVKALGILNTEYSPGDGPYGVPYPGIFIVAPDMTIKGKIFLDGYATRVEARSVLATAKAALGA